MCVSRGKQGRSPGPSSRGCSRCTRNTSHRLSGACVTAEPGGPGLGEPPALVTISCSPRRGPVDRSGRTDRRTEREAGRRGEELPALPSCGLASLWAGGLLRKNPPGGPRGGSGPAGALQGGRTSVRDSRLHSCGCCLEAEEVFLGEPGADGGVIWKTATGVALGAPGAGTPGWWGRGCFCHSQCRAVRQRVPAQLLGPGQPGDTWAVLA